MTSNRARGDLPDSRGHPLDSTSMLFRRIRGGDRAAYEDLFARMRPALARWAHRRLPAHARDLHDTEDLVQLTLTRAFHHVETFEARGQGAFLAYLRRILLNALRDELRRTARRPPSSAIEDVPDGDLATREPSALELAVGTQTIERYERALATMPPDQQEAILMRIELDLPYAEIADALGMVSSEAARKMIGRGLIRLAEAMHEDAG